MVLAVRPLWDTIIGPLSPRLTAAMKEQAWITVTTKVNAVTRVPRTVTEVRNKFVDFKSYTKKKVAKLNKEQGATGETALLYISVQTWVNTLDLRYLV